MNLSREVRMSMESLLAAEKNICIYNIKNIPVFIKSLQQIYPSLEYIIDLRQNFTNEVWLRLVFSQLWEKTNTIIIIFSCDIPNYLHSIIREIESSQNDGSKKRLIVLTEDYYVEKEISELFITRVDHTYFQKNINIHQNKQPFEFPAY